ncbi:MAG: precorrin-6A/cobalt-precorrin-6A reductase [Paracoccaceae bacterium]|jgi:precorrin-6A/cobalt-precorrin-6A reductase
MQGDEKVLVLSGTREGVDLIQQLQEKQVNIIASIAGDARVRLSFAVPVHYGGFATQAEFKDFLGKNKITHVFDASHPNDSQISVQTQQWCRVLDVKFLNITRSGWCAGAGDKWHILASEADVATVITDPARVFLATGRMRLSEFSNLNHCYLYCRQIDVAPDAFPFSNGEYVVGHPPFSVEDEMALFKRLQIDWLVLRNAGGERSMSKLIAARNLGVPVAMIDRPSLVTPSVETVDQALQWLSTC